MLLSQIYEIPAPDADISTSIDTSKDTEAPDQVEVPVEPVEPEAEEVELPPSVSYFQKSNC